MSVEKKYLHNIDLANNKLLNPILNPLTTAQRTAVGTLLTPLDAGYVCFDTTQNIQYFWNGSNWVTVTATTSWGNITGILSNQVDLQSALNAKFDDPTGTISQYIRGDGSLATFPTIPTITPAALTRTNDTNVTLTLGGNPGSALLQAVSLTLGWSGTLDDGRITSANTWNNKQNALNGTGIVKSTAGTISYISGNSGQFVKGDGSLDSNSYITSAVSSVSAGTGMNFSTITNTGSVAIDSNKVPYYSAGFSPGLAKWNGSAWTWDTNNYLTSAVTSVGLSTTSTAFTVSASPVTGIGTLSFSVNGNASQYVRGDGVLATFPSVGGGGGGGTPVSYYLNGGTNQGVFGGDTYYEMNKTPVTGSNVNFTINADGYIAQFITDSLDPSKLTIPSGNWNFQMYFSANATGGTPRFYVELYKVDSTTLAFSLIATSAATPEGITNGTSVDVYTTALAVPTTTLALTDRLAIRVYVQHSNKTITLHTQGTTLCQVATTFTVGLVSLNGLEDQVQNFQKGTSGNDFDIDSTSIPGTHVFNLPVASATNTGKLSNTDYTNFNNKASKGFAVAMAAAL